MNNFDHLYAGKRVLVTGGLGFVGSNLAIRLVQLGAKVTVVDSALDGCGSNYYNLDPVSGEIDCIEQDIGEAETFAAALRECSIIFNLAGEISHSRSMTEPERDLQLNTVSQLRFLVACAKIRPGIRVVYGGTRQVYGKPEYLPVDEDHPIQPVDFNGIHKHAASEYHLLLSRQGALDCAVLRMSNVYGPRMSLSLPQQGFLGVYIRRALLREPIAVFGDGSQLRDPIFVDDVVDAFLAAGCSPQLPLRVYNVGGPQALSLMQIAKLTAAAGGSSIHQVPFPGHLQQIDIGSYATNNAKIRRDLHIDPSVEFACGIRTTLQYYDEHAHAYIREGVRPSPAPVTGLAFAVANV